MHPYINIYNEEEEEVEISRKDLDLFFEWLKRDGLKPLKSERLWRKTILSNLLNDQKMTLANYYDFLEDRGEEMKQIEKEREINMFDYSRLINKTIKTHNGEKTTVKNYIIADSMIHIFFKEGGDLLVSKKYIQKILGT